SPTRGTFPRVESSCAPMSRRGRRCHAVKSPARPRLSQSSGCEPPRRCSSAHTLRRFLVPVMPFFLLLLSSLKLRLLSSELLRRRHSVQHRDFFAFRHNLTLLPG